MKTYDEIVENVVEATAAHRRKMKKIQRIASASAMCAVCVLGLSVYLNLEPQQVLPEYPQNETQTTVTSTVPVEMDASGEPSGTSEPAPNEPVTEAAETTGRSGASETITSGTQYSSETVQSSAETEKPAESTASPQSTEAPQNSESSVRTETKLPESSAGTTAGTVQSSSSAEGSDITGTIIPTDSPTVSTETTPNLPDLNQTATEADTSASEEDPSGSTETTIQQTTTVSTMGGVTDSIGGGETETTSPPSGETDETTTTMGQTTMTEETTTTTTSSAAAVSAKVIPTNVIGLANCRNEWLAWTISEQHSC